MTEPRRISLRSYTIVGSSGTISGSCGRTSGRSTEEPHLLQGIVETLHNGSDTALENATGNHSSTLPKKTTMAGVGCDSTALYIYPYDIGLDPSIVYDIEDGNKIFHGTLEYKQSPLCYDISSKRR